MADMKCEPFTEEEIDIAMVQLIDEQADRIKELEEIIFKVVECVEMNGHGYVTVDKAYENIRKVIKDYGLKIDVTQATLKGK